MSMRNIGKSEGQQVAERVEEFVNGMRETSLDDFVKHMGNAHRTLQQRFMGLCMMWIKHCASGDYQTDLRNQRTKELAQEIIRKIEDTHLPLI